ncbi:hypothetical protein GGX14DRAFT_677605 [Mycena pura]|uniref:Uncharacterized protein n=1 Tax=Mycena pura TaxID=153505 RepID=A0AAD6UW22_9AGAR|nr:hypothetical protein GGX14DRAFT_677605 [Mycena pura]
MIWWCNFGQFVRDNPMSTRSSLACISLGIRIEVTVTGGGMSVSIGSPSGPSHSSRSRLRATHSVTAQRGTYLCALLSMFMSLGSVSNTATIGMAQKPPVRVRRGDWPRFTEENCERIVVIVWMLSRQRRRDLRTAVRASPISTWAHRAASLPLSVSLARSTALTLSEQGLDPKEVNSKDQVPKRAKCHNSANAKASERQGSGCGRTRDGRYLPRPLALARLRHSDLAVAKRRHDCLLLLNARGELDDAGVSRMARRAQRAKATVVLGTILMKCRSCAPPARAPAPPTDKDKGHEISAASLRSRSQLDLS